MHDHFLKVPPAGPMNKEEEDAAELSGRSAIAHGGNNVVLYTKANGMGTAEIKAMEENG